MELTEKDKTDIIKIEISLVASCYGNQDKLRPDGTLGSYADLYSEVKMNLPKKYGLVLEIKSIKTV